MYNATLMYEQHVQTAAHLERLREATQKRLIMLINEQELELLEYERSLESFPE